MKVSDDDAAICGVVARNFARIRRQRGLSQEEVASLSKISQQYLSRLERADCNPTVVTLAKIAKALGIKPVDLLAARSPPT